MRNNPSKRNIYVDIVHNVAEKIVDFWRSPQVMTDGTEVCMRIIETQSHTYTLKEIRFYKL